MKISVKGRYALAAMTHMSANYDNGEYITVVSISERLGISKIYLEQVFSLLKRGGLLESIKGAKGGYKLARQPKHITAEDVLFTAEPSIFEEPSSATLVKAPEIDRAMQKIIFDALDVRIKETLRAITLEDLVLESEKQNDSDGIMFFI